MGGIFPLRGSVSPREDREPRLVELDEDVADEVFDALSSRTTRTIFAELHDSPQTASDLAEVTDTSVQNAQYHLEKLMAADLVEVVDTWYSERGTEMKVYAPTDEALVLFAGEDTESTLRSLLERVVGVLAVLAVGSTAVGLLVDWLHDPAGETFQSAETARREESEELAADTGGSGGGDAAGGGDGGDSDAVSGGDGGGDGGTSATPDAKELEVRNETLRENGTATARGETVDPAATPETGDAAVETATGGTSTPGTLDGSPDTAARITPTPDAELADAALAVGGGLDPALVAGLSFFMGGAFVLVIAGAWYWRAR